MFSFNDNKVGSNIEQIEQNYSALLSNLENFITFNHMIPVAKHIPEANSYIATKSVDINALLLELMFVLEKEDSDEELVSIVKDNLSQIDEIFNITAFDDIKFKINRFWTTLNEIKS